MLKYSEEEKKNDAKKLPKKVEWETVGFCQISNTISHDWRVYELKRCRAFGSFSFDTFFFFARLSNDWSTLGRWLLAVDSYFPACYSLMRRCDSKVSRVSRGYKGSKDSRESRWSRDSRDSRVSRDSKESRMSRRPSAFRSVLRQLLVLQAALFGYRELQQRNRRISVSIRKWFPFRVEWLLTTCRWIDSKKIRSLRVRGDVLYVRAKFKDARNTSTKNFGERNKFLLNSLTLEDVSFNSLL